MMMHINVCKGSDGFSFVENLIAAVLIVTALGPAVILISRYGSLSPAVNLHVAANLAQQAMESMLAQADFSSGTKTIILNQRQWYIERAVDRGWNLVEITIRVRPMKQKNWTVEFYTCRAQ